MQDYRCRCRRQLEYRFAKLRLAVIAMADIGRRKLYCKLNNEKTFSSLLGELKNMKSNNPFV